MIYRALLLFTLLWIAQSQDASSKDPAPIIFPGQLNLGLVLDLHEDANGRCGSLQLGSALQVLAALWSVQQINVIKEPQQLNIGVYIYDTCGQIACAHRQVFRLVENVGHVQSNLCLEERIPPVFGVIGQGKDGILDIPAQTLQAFNIPYFGNTKGTPEVVFSTLPSPGSLVRAALSMLSHLGWKSVILREDIQQIENLKDLFLSESFLRNISVTRKADGDNTKAIIFFLDSEKAIDLVRNSSSFQEFPLIIVTTKDISQYLKGLTHLQQNILLISPLPQTPDSNFIDFVNKELLENETYFSNPLLSRMKQELKRTYGDVVFNVSSLFKFYSDEMNQVNAIIKSVKILVSALRIVEKRSCSRGVNCMSFLKGTINSEVLQILKKSSNSSTGLLYVKDLTTHFKFTEDGHLTTSKIGLTAVSVSQQLEGIGWYSENSGLALDLVRLSGQTVFGISDLSPYHLHASYWRSAGIKQGRSFITKPQANLTIENQTERISYVKPVISAALLTWVGQPWVLTILVLSIGTVLFTFYIIVFLLMKICERVLKRTNHFINFSLLFSLFFLQFGAALFTFKLTPILSISQRLVHNLSYTITFACLLVKTMDFHTKKSLGLGGRASRLNQLLTLLFIIGVQIALEVQWILLAKPSSEIYHQLKQWTLDINDFIFSQIYIIFLLLMATGFSYFTRSIPYHHKEGQGLFYVMLLLTSIFSIRIFLYVFLNSFEARCVSSSLGMLATSIIILAGIYLPQLYRIHKSGGLAHKPLSYTDSFSSVFTLFKEFEPMPEESSSLQRSRKPPKTLETSYSKSMVDLNRDTLPVARTPSMSSNR